MSGHSKWSQIKRQKGVADVKRGAAYTKLAKTIQSAVREGGKDPSMNIRLRFAIDQAKSINMPNTTIERAIKRGAGEVEGAIIERIVYECFGPGGIAILAEAFTDNKNRTTAEVRSILNKHNGNLGSLGSVQWMFEQRGIIVVDSNHLSDEQELALIDAGAEDVECGDADTIIVAKPNAMQVVKLAAEQLGFTVSEATIAMTPKNTETSATKSQLKQSALLCNELESLDDLTAVTSNAQTTNDANDSGS